MVKTNVVESAEVPVMTPSPGEMLRVARERASLTTREVGDKLHLLPRQIEWLEADDYEQFNGEIFCKGYIKSYGKLLGLDYQVLIDAYTAVRPEPAVESVAAVSRRHIQRPHKGRSIQYWCLAITVLVLALLWGLRASDDEGQASPVLENAEVIVDKRAVINVPGSTVQLAIAEPATGTLGKSEASAVAPVRVPEQLPADQIVASAEIQTDAALPVGSEVEDTEPEGTMNFRFSKDCWVEIRDSDNRVLFANLKRARDTLSVTGKAPFKVLLGYAPGVEMEYNGEPVTITVNRKNNAARFTVGRL